MVNNTVFRYVVNGALATVVHYVVLYVNIEVIRFDSVGISNFLAAFCGIFVSFVGNRVFVFCNKKDNLVNQIRSFALLYFSIALLHGVFLHIWSDLYNMDYRVGFILATIMQALLSYIGNKKIVFR